MKSPNVLHLEVMLDPSLVLSQGTGKAAKRRRNGDRALPPAAVEQLMRLLSARNVGLLRLIRSARPQSVAELARLSGRPKVSLMQTLQRLEHFGIVAFQPTGGLRKIPVVVCDRIELDLPLAPPHGGGG